MNARELAFIALFESLKENAFIQDTLNHLKKKYNLSILDEQLTRQIAVGSMQRALSLDYFVKQASKDNKLNLKVKEKALLRTAVYQMAFLDRIPRYAIVDETVKIAKKHFNRFFVNFLNAILRKLADAEFILPRGKDHDSLSIHYSYPKYYIKALIDAYGLEKSIDLLTIGNNAAKLTARVKKDAILQDGMEVLYNESFKVVSIPNAAIAEVSQSKDFYIQNTTPVYLIDKLASKLKKAPQFVLDMCASPGGKTLTLKELFKCSDFYVNDVSETKIKRLKENFEKYAIDVFYSLQDGKELNLNQKFDLIILDVPCSNTGVLNKRPEARYRLSKENIKEIEKLQFELLNSAKKNLKPDGTIWYMTCSILPAENELLVEKFAQESKAKVIEQFLVLPSEQGFDGGFGCAITFE
jgi:16S rRNA (cytosine967-C5)-methyltransferase